MRLRDNLGRRGRWCQVSYVTDATVSNAADAALQRVTVAIRPRPSVVHPSVALAVTLIPRLLSEPIRLTDVAAAVHLSPDRLGRLFARDLGLSFSAYVRWSRLIRAMEVARTGGTSLTPPMRRDSPTARMPIVPFTRCSA